MCARARARRGEGPRTRMGTGFLLIIRGVGEPRQISARPYMKGTCMYQLRSIHAAAVACRLRLAYYWMLCLLVMEDNCGFKHRERV